MLDISSKTITDKIKEVSTNNYSRLELDNLMRDYERFGAGETGVQFSFPFDFTVSERYMIDSMTNPQSNKTIRFLVTSDDLTSTIPVVNGKLSSDELTIYKKGIAQAFDLDPDKHSDVVALKALDKFMSISSEGAVIFTDNIKDKSGKEVPNPFYDAFSKLKELMNSDDPSSLLISNDNKASRKQKEFNEAMIRATSAGSKFHTIQALMSLVALDKYSKNGFKSGEAFKTNFSLESDAITSGMILTLMQIGTRSAIEMASKGGVYNKDVLAKWEAIYTTITTSAIDHGLEVFPSLNSVNKNGNKEFKLTHGWLLDFNDYVQKILSMSESQLSSDAKSSIVNDLATAVMSSEEKQGLKGLEGTDRDSYIKSIISNKVEFNDFYNTVASKANSELQLLADGLSNEIESGKAKLAELTNDANYNNDPKKSSEVKSLAKDIDDANVRFSLAKFIGKISRSMAKPPVMVYIYGAMMASIKNKLLTDIVAPKMYSLFAGENVSKIHFHRFYTGLLSDAMQGKQEFLDAVIADAEKGGMAHDNAAEFATASYELFKKVFYSYNEDRNSKILTSTEFKKYNPISGAIENIKELDDKLLGNMIIPGDLLSNLKHVSDDVVGSAFESGFKVFHEADQYRESIKTVEIVRFTMFKYEYDKKIRQLISTMSPDKNGDYKIAVADLQRIIYEIEEDGLGHSVDDINGGKQPLYKKDRQEDKYKAILATTKGFSSFSVEGFSYAPNTGASGVITVHSIDGFIDSTSAKAFSLIRIYDGSVSGINKLNESMYEYNKSTHDAIGFNTFNTQFNTVAAGIKKLLDRGELNDMLKYFATNKSDSDRNALLNTIEKLMGYGSIQDLTEEVIASKMNESSDRVLKNIEARTENGSPTKLQYGHSYFTDSADLYKGELSDGSSTPLNANSIFSVYKLFGEIVKVLQDHDLMQRYGTTDIKTIGEDSGFKFTFDKLTKKSVEEVANAAKANGLKAPIYLFGDNLEKKGTSGQAAIRYAATKNVIGIPTKKNPTMKESAFFTDADFDMAKIAIDKAFDSIPLDRTVIVPASGLVTGLADLATRSPVIFNYINQKLEELRQKLNENQQEDTQDDNLERKSDYQIHSGGAYGADTLFGLIGKEYGMHTYHYRSNDDKQFSSSLAKDGQKAEFLTDTQIQEGLLHAQKAASALGRSMPANAYAQKLLARNWYQIKRTIDNNGAVYAIAKIKGRYVEGGTGYAVAMAVENNVPVYVFDYTKEAWYERGKDSWTKLKSVPPLTKDFAGIGSRSIENYKTKSGGKSKVEYAGDKARAAADSAIRELLAQSKNAVKEDNTVNSDIQFQKEISGGKRVFDTKLYQHMKAMFAKLYPEIKLVESDTRLSREMASMSTMLQLSKKLRTSFEAAIAKSRPDLVQSGEDKTLIDDVEKYVDNAIESGVFKEKDRAKLSNISFQWSLKGNVKINEDFEKVSQAVDIASKKGLDVFKYSSPNEIIEQYAHTIKEKPVDPDTIKEFTNKRDLGNGVVTYDVPTTDEGQAAARQVLDTHFGEDSNPWCLLQRDESGLTGNAERYWNHYQGQKRIAFQHGKLVAFHAGYKWWDRDDHDSYGIRVVSKLEGDSLGRSQRIQVKDDMVSDKINGFALEGEPVYFDDEGNGYDEFDNLIHAMDSENTLVFPEYDEDYNNSNIKFIGNKYGNGTYKEWKNDVLVLEKTTKNGNVVSLIEYSSRGQKTYELATNGEETTHTRYQDNVVAKVFVETPISNSDFVIFANKAVKKGQTSTYGINVYGDVAVDTYDIVDSINIDEKTYNHIKSLYATSQSAAEKYVSDLYFNNQSSGYNYGDYPYYGEIDDDVETYLNNSRNADVAANNNIWDNISDDDIPFQKIQEDILGMADLKAGKVFVDTMLQGQDTLPHEYAHHYISWFRDTKIVQQGIKKFGSEEALVQAIGEQSAKQLGEAYSWFKRFTKWLRNAFNKIAPSDRDKLVKELTDAFLTRKDISDNPNKTNNTNDSVEQIVSFSDQHSNNSKVLANALGDTISLNDAIDIADKYENKDC
jgi:hypothetical protein